MEPRSLERGNLTVLYLHGAWRSGNHGNIRSFDGAAFSRTRKPLIGNAVLRSPNGFNGAAFSRTRKLLRFERWSHLAVQIRFNGAAFSRTRKLPSKTGVLQHASMEPRSLERGNHIYRVGLSH